MYRNCDKSGIKPGFEALESRLLLAADLTIEAAADVYEALVGAEVNVDVQVNNIGDAAAEAAADPGVEPWTVSLWISEDDVFNAGEDTEVLEDTFELLTLAAGANDTDIITFTAPAAGAYWLFGFADSDEEVTEDSEVNNTSIVGTLLVGIDLEIQGAAGAYEAAAGANVDVDVTAENTGFAQAVTDDPGDAPWIVSLWTSTDGTWDAGDTQVGSYNVTTLDGQDTTTSQISFAAPVPGEYTLFGFADSDEEVTEDDDTNNTASLGTLSVGPDLTITAAATVYQAADGQQVDVPVQVNNAGFAVAEDDADPGVDPWTVSLWLSTDGAFDAGDDTQVGSYNVTTLAAGADTTDTISFNAPAGAQSYTLFGVADQPGGVTEYDEDNNASVVGTLGVGPDLTIAIDDDFVTGAEQIPGDRWRIPVQVTNGGAGTASGLATIQLYGSVDGVIDGGDYLFGQRTCRISLAAAQAGTYWLVSQVPADIPAGDYNVLAVVDSGDTIAEADEDNNTDAAANQADIVWKFGGFDAAHPNSRMAIEDPNGDLVTFVMRGSWAEVANGTNGFDVTLYETTRRSVFAMTTARGVTTEVESITVDDDVGLAWDGSLGRIHAPTVDFVDDGAGTSLIDVPGTLRLLWLNDVNGGEVQVGAQVGARDTFSMRLGSVIDLVVTSGTPVGWLIAQDWTDTDAVADVVTTPSINHFRATGDVDDLDLTLAGNLVAGRHTLGTARVGGDLIDAAWDIDGSAARVAVLGTINGSALTFDENVRSIYAGAIDNSAIALATVNPAGAHATLGLMYVRGVGVNYFINNSTLDVWTIRRLCFRAASVGTGTITYNTVGRTWNAPTGVNLVVV